MLTCIAFRFVSTLTGGKIQLFLTRWFDARDKTITITRTCLRFGSIFAYFGDA